MLFGGWKHGKLGVVLLRAATLVLPRTTTTSAWSVVPSRGHRRSSTASSTRFVVGSSDIGQATTNLWSIEECLRNRESIKFVDASWYHKGDRNGRSEFERGPRIPGAVYWDMDDLATSKDLYPESNPKGLRVMFPPRSLIAAALEAMGIAAGDTIVVYGREGCWFAPRTWYLLKTFFDDTTTRVGLLRGSLEDWQAAGGPIDDAPLEYQLRGSDLIGDNQVVGEDDKLDRLLGMDEMLREVKRAAEGNESTKVLVDTRGTENFDKGHIPGAIHIPYKSLVEDEGSSTTRIRSREDLGAILRSHNIPKDRPIWLSCGSGVSVCHVALALEECGYPKPYIYDGSWNEWGADPTTPKEVTSG